MTITKFRENFRLQRAKQPLCYNIFSRSLMPRLSLPVAEFQKTMVTEMRQAQSKMRPKNLIRPIGGFGIKEYIGLSPRKKPILKKGAPNPHAGYVFICGLHRSGTTLVEQYLSAYCNSSLLRAPVFENEGQHLQDCYPQAYLYGGPGTFAFNPEMSPPIPTQDDAEILRDKILSYWSPWTVGNGDILIEKSPPNLTKISWLRRVFPKSKFLIVTRDPRAVAAATLKWSKSTIPELIYHWHVAHSIALEEYGSDCSHVRYEDFCEDPVANTKIIARDLQLPMREAALPIDDRFKSIRASNSKYLTSLPKMRYGRGCWEHFKYDLEV